MKPSKLEKALLAVARATPPSDRVPYAFEQRILARLRSLPKVDLWAEWAHALWRSAAACMAVAVLMGTLSAFVPPKPPPLSNDLALDLEKTLLAAMDGEYPR